jgi:hypothetical protein
MKKALIIVAAVAGYALIETVLLLSAVPHGWNILDWNILGTYQKIIFSAQILLIPGIALLWSRVLHGSYRWGRRTLIILLVGTFGVLGTFPVAFILIAIPIALLVWAFGVSKILLVVLLPTLLSADVIILLFCVRKSGKLSAEAEARRWLAERSEMNPRDRKWRTRAICLSSAIPMLIVMPVFLFFPETWGLFSHLSRQRPGSLAGYQVTIPATWIVSFHLEAESDGESWVDGLIGKGIGRGGNPLHYDSLSGWNVGTAPFDEAGSLEKYRWMPEEQNIINRRVLRADNENITCLDYFPSYGYRYKTMAYVDCSGSRRLYATFIGSRDQLGAFYRMLEGIKSMP